MTCIVGYLDKKTKKVTIGGDSAGVAGLDITIRKDEKVFKVKQLYAEIFDVMNQIRIECTARPSEKARLCSVAITEAQ